MEPLVSRFSPSEEDAPLIISGFSSEAEALAWIDGQRNKPAKPQGNPENLM